MVMGKHCIIRSSTEDLEQAIGSGMYLYHSKTQKNATEKKMVLVK